MIINLKFTKMKTFLTTLLSLFISFYSYSQEKSYSQTIRGKVIDADTEIPIPGVSIVIDDLLTNDFMANTNALGEFRINNVPVGKHTIRVILIGYKPVVLSNISVNSGKETFLNISMEMDIFETEEVIVLGTGGKSKTQNEMAVVSARSFSVDETERYAGSLGDPSRMAANFAGVMSVSDQRNDIIIRGNSPTGLLWKIDGVNVPNPNHFGALGTTGGPVSILNNNLLANSDFFTGAFPAEYGNAISGVFDLKMRNGNNEKREYVAQVGFNGFELGAEGPFSKKSRASYLVNFRYSTLEVMDLLGLNDGTGASVPQYKDLSFKLNFPLKKGRFSLFGIGGKSYIELLDKGEGEASYGVVGTNTYFGSNMGVTGLTHVHFINDNTKIQNSISYSVFQSYTKLDSLYDDRTSYPYYRNDFIESKFAYSLSIKKRFNRKSSLSLGMNIDYFMFNLIDSVKRTSILPSNPQSKYITITDSDGDFVLYQAHTQWKYKFTNKLTLYAGIHFQQASLNSDYAIEPRVAIQWNLAQKHSLNLGGGMHSILQPHSSYFVKTELNEGTLVETNNDLGFTKSDQIVLSYNYYPSKNFRIKFETYYQNLHNIPVSENYQWYAAVNSGAEFGGVSLDSLINDGTGKNYGLELTIEKFFSKNYYFLITTSLYESKYTAYDKIERNTAFNGNFVVNGLFGYEFKIGKNNFLTLNLKQVWAGGKRINPIDLEKSKLAHKSVYDYSNLYSERYDDYVKTDVRIGFKHNRKKSTHEWAIDLQNVTNNKNVFQQNYNPKTEEIQTDFQTGFMPMFLYRLRF